MSVFSRATYFSSYVTLFNSWLSIGILLWNCCSEFLHVYLLLFLICTSLHNLERKGLKQIEKSVLSSEVFVNHALGRQPWLIHQTLLLLNIIVVAVLAESFLVVIWDMNSFM